jgi:hypothetical protein
MAKHALEVHMLSVGDADCILVTWWDNDSAERLLIDSGDADTVDKVKAEFKPWTRSHSLEIPTTTRRNRSRDAAIPPRADGTRFDPHRFPVPA